MNREDVRDQLMEPVLQWTRLGRQLNQGFLAAAEVAAQSTYGIWCGRVPAGVEDWESRMQLARATVGAQLEGVAALMTQLPTESAHFWTRTTGAMAACASAAASIAVSGDAEEIQARQARFGDALIGGALAWYQLFSTAANLTEAAVSPLLHQVKTDARRLR